MVPFSGPSIRIFYVLNAVYFTLSALQLKYGIPEFTGRMAIMKNYTTFNNVCLKVYKATPFFSEVKTFMDWTFTTTSLDLFQWLKLEELHQVLFETKVSSDYKFQRKLGEKIDPFEKFYLGFCGIFLIILLVLGPMMLFSTYNPVGRENYVVGATINVGFEFGGNFFGIFKNSHVSAIKRLEEIKDFDISDFKKQPGSRDVDIAKIQYMTMAPFSEQLWSIAQPNYNQFKEEMTRLRDLLSQFNVSQLSENSTTKASLQINLQFFQLETQENNIAPTISTIKHNFYQSQGGEFYSKKEVNDTLNQLLRITDCSGEKLVIKQAYDSLIRLGTQQPATPVSDYKIGQKFYQDLNIQLKCLSTKDDDTGIANSYWQISTNDRDNQGLIFFAITNKVPGFLVSFSIQAFYIGIVFFAGTFTKRALAGQISNLTLCDLPAAEEIIQIYEGILIARADKNLVKEERLYWELMDILRSPEVLKLITKSAVQERLNSSEKLKMD